MRVKDMYGILARNVTQVEHTPDAPRHFKILMTNTENDMEGESGDKGLAHYVPCICLSVLQEPETLVIARLTALFRVLTISFLNIFHVFLTLPVLIMITRFLYYHLTIPTLVHLFLFLGRSVASWIFELQVFR